MKVLLKAGAVGPGLAASTLVYVIVSAGVPTSVRETILVAVLTVGVLLAVGVGERWAVQALFGARPPREHELTALGPMLEELNRLQLGPPATQIYVARRPGAPAAIGLGRRSVVVADELVAGLTRGELPEDEALAVLAHASVTVRAGLSRQDVAIAFWSTPWRLIRSVVRPGRGLFGLAWKARIIVFSAAIWQCLVSGPPGVGSFSAFVLMLILVATYTTTWFARRWQRHVEEVGDRELVVLGMGQAMGRFVHRYPSTQIIAARRQRLDRRPQQTAPLRSVGG